jgi:hypothetical protein
LQAFFDIDVYKISYIFQAFGIALYSQEPRKSGGPDFSTIVGSISAGSCCLDLDTLSRTSLAAASGQHSG